MAVVPRALGHGPEGSDSGFDRLAALASGLAYGGMCVLAVEILLGSGSSAAPSPRARRQAFSAGPPEHGSSASPGAVLIGVALDQGYGGVTQKFLDDSKTEEMSPGVRKWIGWIGTVGHLARMVVFGLIGIFLIKAAIDYNPKRRSGSTVRWRSSHTTPMVRFCSGSSRLV